MKKIAAALSVMLIAATPFAAQATPDDDLKAFRSYFTNKFPDVPMNDFSNGVYAIDALHVNNGKHSKNFLHMKSLLIAVKRNSTKNLLTVKVMQIVFQTTKKA